MPEHRPFPKFLALAAAVAILVPLVGVNANDELLKTPGDIDPRLPVIDVTDYSAATASAAGTVSVFLQGKTDNVLAKRNTTLKVEAVDGDGVLIRDARLFIEFGDGKRKRYEFDRRLTFEHKWKDEGSYKLTFDLQKDGESIAKGKFRLRVHKARKLFIEVLGDDRVKLDEPTDFRFMVMAREARGVKGVLTVDWGDGTIETIDPFDGDEVLSHVYTSEGNYKIKVSIVTPFGESQSNRQGFGLEVTEQSGEIDLRQAIIAPNAAQDIENFRITSVITGVRITRGEICIFHTKAGKWPVRDGLEGNPWIATFYQGKLHAGTYEWLRPGQTCKTIDAAKSGGTHKALGPHIAAGDLKFWVPQLGEEIWLWVSTFARLSWRSIDEMAAPFYALWPF